MGLEVAPGTQESSRAAQEWLAAFVDALRSGDGERAGALFAHDGAWRDLLACTWQLRTFIGPTAVGDACRAAAASGRSASFTIEGAVTTNEVERAGRPYLECRFDFSTALASGAGLLRLPAEGGGAVTLLTALVDVTGLQERNGEGRPRGSEYSRTFGDANWLDLRREAIAFEDREPQVLVVGAGQAGLAIAARLGQLGIDTLVVEREARVGDNWRHRYHSLTLHNVVWTNHLPYLPFPPTFPVYIPKDMLANWFELYAEALELNVWTDTAFLGGRYDNEAGRWEVEVDSAERGRRLLRPRHVVIATGVSGIARIPELPGLSEYRGTVVHSSAFGDGRRFAGQRALVIGTGTSGHDCAQELHAVGASVTLVQRSSTTVLSIEPSAISSYSLYQEGGDVFEADLLTLSFAHPLAIDLARALTDRCVANDRELIDRLHEVGFRTDEGPDGTGWQLKYLRQGGGYYFDVGCADLVASGKIALRQYDEIDRFTDRGVRLVDGSEEELDLVVLATGYHTMSAGVAALFGDEVAERVGEVWGLDDEGELRNVWKRTGQAGLWFTMGSLAHARIFSKYLALQIWDEERDRTLAASR
jgi:cation diffusion facilitator CzcD-associated flavoprotein CzcO